MSDPVITKEDKKVLKEAETIIENAGEPKKLKIKLTWIISAVCILAILLLLLSTGFALLNIGSDRIVKGVYIKGIDVSNLTPEEATKKVTDSLSALLGMDLTLVHNEEEITLSPADFYASFDIEQAVTLAYQVGCTGNIFEQNFQILNALASQCDILPGLSSSPDLLAEKLSQIEQSLPDYVVQPSYSIDGNELKIQKGKQGVAIEKAVITEEIVTILSNLENTTKKITLPTTTVIPDELDMGALYQEVHKDAVDAYYTRDPFTVHPSSNGVDFAISLDEAKAQYAEAGEEYVIPLKVVYPKVSTNQIGNEAFPDQLATFSTKFSTKNTNRSTNIRLAVKKINGSVLMPGQSFSYNQTVGKRTIAAGFKVAGVYANGEVTEGVGGGICQVSSTLYNSVLLSNLEVVERHNHSFNPGYVPAGQDATVSWGGPDFKFKNNRSYPVRIVASVSGGTITVQIFGMKQDDDYTVRIKSSVIGSIPFKTTYKTDGSLAPGETKVLQKGSNGVKSVTYKILSKNGQEVSRKEISRDIYNPHNKIIATGGEAAPAAQ